jgi:hypothetical protein
MNPDRSTSRTRRRLLLVFALAAAGIAAGASAPSVLRRVDAFRVRRVEVRGTHFIAPHDALRQSGIDTTSNVFDDFEPARRALEEHPLIASARIQTRVPGTVRIFVEEAQPVAFVALPELQPVDGAGRLLPVKSGLAALDLPLIGIRIRPHDGRVVDPQALAVIGTLDHIRRVEPALFDRISEAAPERGTGIRLTLRSPQGATAFVPADPSNMRLNELRLALADLAARGELNRLSRVDARWSGQIVVSLTSTAAN